MRAVDIVRQSEKWGLIGFWAGWRKWYKVCRS